MIGRICGELILKRPPELLVDVGGIGYELQAPMSTIFELPEVGQKVTLVTHFHVREDAQILFAFLTEAERSLFRMLLKVNGVGAKTALAILSGMNPQEFRQCILGGDQASLTRVPGIGKKTAERLIVEMRDRLEKADERVAPAAASSGATSADVVRDSPVTEATQALVALGYKPQDASRMVARHAADGLASDELIRLALKGTL
ncbi:MAG: Holliday junction branch migration protein RuvA [Thiothrix sp.]|nr:MAG: Holliday junction branch migration protein RuvA [Thiothrix sp.]